MSGGVQSCSCPGNKALGQLGQHSNVPQVQTQPGKLLVGYLEPGRWRVMGVRACEGGFRGIRVEIGC